MIETEKPPARWIETACDSCQARGLAVYAPVVARAFPALCHACRNDPEIRKRVEATKA